MTRQEADKVLDAAGGSVIFEAFNGVVMLSGSFQTHELEAVMVVFREKLQEAQVPTG